jgi:hypothetical protein
MFQSRTGVDRMDLMLSSTSDFEGGVFCTLEPDGSLTNHTFERGDLLIFLSHKYASTTST